MKRYTLAAVLGMGALLLGLGPPLRADGIDNFTYTEQLTGGNTLRITWSLPASTGTPNGNSLEVVGATLTYCLNGGAPYQTTTDSTIYFFASGAGTLPSSFGGFELLDAANVSSSGFKNYVIQPANTTIPGAQLYSLTGGTPTFVLGTYSFNDVAYGAGNPYGAYNPGTLVISTPEPSAFLLLLTGLLAAGVILTLKKATA